MTASQIFAFASNSLALILTLGMIQWLVLRRGWRTATGWALLQFLLSLVVLQSARLLMLVSVLADYPPMIVEGTANLTLMSLFGVALTGFSLLLHAGNTMKAAWQVANRAGVTGLIALLPGLWYFDLLQFPTTLDDSILGHAYTTYGSVVAGLCTFYLILTLIAAWRFWRQIDAPTLVVGVAGLALIQLAELGLAPLRDLGLSGALGGLASLMFVYFFMAQWEIDPYTSQASWLTIARRIADILTINQPLPDTLAHLAEQIRHLVRCDSVVVLIAISTERLEVIAAVDGGPATDNPLKSIVGRQIRQGEGLAGRVMQTLYPMRVDNYHIWNGHSPDFDDLPIYASMSVPLLFDGSLVGVINASETSPGRTFTDRDQRMLELLAPQMAVIIVTNQLNADLYTTSAYLQAVLEHTTVALLIFDAVGLLRQANPLAQRYLRLWFGDHRPSAIEFAAQADDTQFTEALVQWAVRSRPVQMLETTYPSLGPLHIEIQPIVTEHTGQSDLLVLMRPASDLSPE